MHSIHFHSYMYTLYTNVYVGRMLFLLELEAPADFQIGVVAIGNDLDCMPSMPSYISPVLHRSSCVETVNEPSLRIPPLK